MRDRSKDTKAAWLLGIGCVTSFGLTFVVPSDFRWLFVGAGVLFFCLFADHLGYMATGFFRDGDMDARPEIEKIPESEILSMRKTELVGKVGRALTDIVVYGRGEVDGKMFDCIADQIIAKGENFRVTGLAMSELKIEKLNKRTTGNSGASPLGV